LIHGNLIRRFGSYRTDSRIVNRGPGREPGVRMSNRVRVGLFAVLSLGVAFAYDSLLAVAQSTKVETAYIW
jgi:hypothetical protein